MQRRPAVVGLAALFVVCTSAHAVAEEPGFSDADILGQRPRVRVERVQTRITAYDQRGFGYQSQAGPLLGPGSETLHVLQAQGEFVIHQGDRISHRLWVPVDVVTSASANAVDSYYAEPDVISTASAQNVASQIEYELSVKANRDETWSGGVSFHHEENFLSWMLSLGYERSVADDNATLSVGVNQVLDWFDQFRLGGYRAGRASRSSTNLNVSLSQLLSPTTVVSAGYGLTLQRGQLSNTWNTVPAESGERVSEVLPRTRVRHAFAFGLAQWLPWQGALDASLRLYGDGWGVRAQSVEAALHQSVGPLLLLGANVRYHHQSAVWFFTTRAPAGQTILSADSDLGAFEAVTLGGTAELTLPTARFGRLFLSLGYDHYFRSDELRVNVATWASGFRF
ncbi:MAG TPA: DUF3570 domain-containing protein [Polyangiaceae bacterium]